ncbi:ARSB [Symbiodinium natans]|uniref:ARSB protein n=1 Tax=Symbiodinium natans TaxID=878477 RepID=A0A812V9Z7_9DINO|nr:ARSB [Symbiodinium natans]
MGASGTSGTVLRCLLVSLACLRWAAGAHCEGEGCKAAEEAESTELLQHAAKDSAAKDGWGRYNSYGHGGGGYKKPNILVIIIDDMGWNQVGFRARPANLDVVTPNIDWMASEGIIMDRFYATPWCAPSRGALQTGRLDVLNPYIANNVWNWDPSASYVDKAGQTKTTPIIGGVQPNTLTIGKRLKEMGYRTHLNGKWGIGGGAFLNTPMGMGYETFMGWFGDSMESCDGTEPGFAVGGAGPLMNALPGFWRQDSTENFNSSWCELLRADYLLGKLSEEEFFVGCKSFKQELDDVADEKIRRRSRQIILEHNYEEAPLFLVHALQLMHLPIQYPRRFARTTVQNLTHPTNEDLRSATYGALEYVDWVIGDLTWALTELKQYQNTIVFLTSDNGGAIYAGTANNNYPLRGGKFNNFEGGQRVNALFSGGWVTETLQKYHVQPFTSNTVMSINDLSETLLEMITGRPYPDGGMRNEPGPLTGVPMWRAIFEKTQVPRKITYSEVMELRVGANIVDLKKIWFTENSTLISDGNWTPNFPNNSQFIPDFAYKYVRPCSQPYCYFDLHLDPFEQKNLPLDPLQEEALRQEVREDWDLFVIDTSRVRQIDRNIPTPKKVSLWTHMGASGPFLNAAAVPVIPPFAECWCRWIDDGLEPESVTHVIFNLYLGPRCVDDAAAQLAPGALRCRPPLRLTQAPIPWNLSEALWAEIGFETEDFDRIRKAEWLVGPFSLPVPLLLLEWNLPVIAGLRAMNDRIGFANWANIGKYPFNLAYTDHCPEFDIFTAPTPVTQVTDWLLSAGIFNNPTGGAGNGTERNVTACFPINATSSVCPTLDNNPPTVDGYNVPVYGTLECLQYCVLWNPDQ